MDLKEWFKTRNYLLKGLIIGVILAVISCLITFVLGAGGYLLSRDPEKAVWFIPFGITLIIGAPTVIFVCTLLGLIFGLLVKLGLQLKGGIIGMIAAAILLSIRSSRFFLFSLIYKPLALLGLSVSPSCSYWTCFHNPQILLAVVILVILVLFVILGTIIASFFPKK